MFPDAIGLLTSQLGQFVQRREDNLSPVTASSFPHISHIESACLVKCFETLCSKDSGLQQANANVGCYIKCELILASDLWPKIHTTLWLQLGMASFTLEIIWYQCLVPGDFCPFVCVKVVISINLFNNKISKFCQL